MFRDRIKHHILIYPFCFSIPVCPSRTALTPYFFSFRFLLGKINDFRVLTTKLCFAVSFNQCYFISVTFNREAKYCLSVRQAESIS